MAWKDLAPWVWGRLGKMEEDNPIAVLEQRVNTLFRDFKEGFGLGGAFAPRVNYSEDNERVYVEIELPGLSDKDIEVSLTKDALTVRGEKRQEEERRQGKDLRYTEISYGSFERVIPLRTEIDEDKVDAEFKDGVLRITIVKTEAAKRQVKKVSIKT